MKFFYKKIYKIRITTSIFQCVFLFLKTKFFKYLHMDSEKSMKSFALKKIQVNHNEIIKIMFNHR